MNLLVVEMRRALHRRVVWGLVGLALALCALGGVISYVDSRDLNVLLLERTGQTHAAVMEHWWIPGGGDGILPIAAIALLLGGLIGGASVAGAEWKAGTVTTVLTWEPRRGRLHAARTASAGLLAFVIALGLQVVFLAAFVPSVVAHGSTGDIDGAWWLGLVAAMVRIAAITACSAVIGVSLATIGRSTAFAIVTAWVWLAVGEGIVRSLAPDQGRLLLGESSTTVLAWARLDTDHAVLDVWPALGLALVYVTILTAIGTASFLRRDVAG
jgi:hypothetical protein